VRRVQVPDKRVALCSRANIHHRHVCPARSAAGLRRRLRIVRARQYDRAPELNVHGGVARIRRNGR
jgi:hypothetical protein